MSPLPMRAEDGGWLVLSIAFALGACVGSCLNVCIHRLPQDESVLRPASRCPRCATPIAWRDNIPLLSWLLLGARCRACRTPIPARYPLVEAATGALAVLALVGFGPSAAAAVAFLFTAALLLVTFVDFDHRFIPDEVSLPGIAVGVGAAFLPRGVGPLDALAGAVLGGGVLWAVAWSYEHLTGVEGMGFGDVKLLAMIGAFLGWQAIPAVLVVASLTGSLAGLALIFTRRGRWRPVAGECRTRRPARRRAVEEAGYAAHTRVHAARGRRRPRPGHGPCGGGRRAARRPRPDGAARGRGARGGNRAQAGARHCALGRRVHRGPLRSGACPLRDARTGGTLLSTRWLPPGVGFAALPARSRVLFGGLGSAENATITLAAGARMRSVIVNQRGRVRVQ